MGRTDERLRIVGLTGDSQDDGRAELIAGLSSRPRFLPPRFGYDGRGSGLYEQIMRLPEYYLPGSEMTLISTHGAELAARSKARTFVDFGCGNGEKSETLAEHLVGCGLRRYVPVDIDVEILRVAARRLLRRWPDLNVTALVADFNGGLSWPWRDDRPGARLFALLGSTYGNLRLNQRLAFIRRIRAVSGPADRLLLGVDLPEPAELVRNAYEGHYDGRSAIRREFALNRLVVINELFDADFDPRDFRPYAVYDRGSGTVRGLLRVSRSHRVEIRGLGLRIDLRAGEEIVRDIMKKLTPAEVRAEVRHCGFRLDRLWIESKTGYGLFLFSPAR